MHGEQPRMPHSLAMMRVPTEEELIKSSKDYETYADELSDRFDVMLAAFRDARIKVAVDLTYKHALQMKPLKEVKWLQPGKLVVVYRPTSSKDGENWTSKLLYQFAGPYRIIKVFRNAVHLKTLDGRSASTQSIDNVYPYSAKCDEVMEQFDRRWLSASEHENSFDALEGKMIIVDGNFEIHLLRNARQKSSVEPKEIPNWYEPNPNGPGHLEKCTADPTTLL
jgi:hypothetical protein